MESKITPCESGFRWSVAKRPEAVWNVLVTRVLRNPERSMSGRRPASLVHPVRFPRPPENGSYLACVNRRSTRQPKDGKEAKSPARAQPTTEGGPLTYGSRRSIFLAARRGTGASPLGDDNGSSGNATLPAAFFGTAAAPAAPGAGTGRCERAVSLHTRMTTCPRGCHRRTCSSDVTRLRRNSRASRGS